MRAKREMGSVSRRRVLQMAMSVVPLFESGPFTDALRRVDADSAVRHADDELLVLGAREAVARLRRGELEVEAYVARLLAQYDTHKDLNVANAIDPARVMEAARLADRMRRRSKTLGPAFGLPFAVKDQIAVAGYRRRAAPARSVDTYRSVAPPWSIASCSRQRAGSTPSALWRARCRTLRSSIG